MKQSSKHFRTALKKVDFPFEIKYSDRIMFIGSCFTENIGKRMESLKFQTRINPFGILYNPVSVKNALQNVILGFDFQDEDLVEHNGLWHSLMHHGSFSSHDKERCLDNINKVITDADEFLQKADYLFVTFGTAWLYEYVKTGEVVGNCHKLPASEFNKRLLNADEITIEFYQLLNDLQNYNPNLKIILSISPVRHLKDGFSENSLSKAILKVAVSQISERFDNVFYFPSYEIMTDDLRDYRFYAEDMLHPSDEATNYIFDIFSDSFFNKDTMQRINEVETIIKGAKHRVLHPGTTDYQTFINTMLKKIKEQDAKSPVLDFSDELKYFENQKKG